MQTVILMAFSSSSSSSMRNFSTCDCNARIISGGDIGLVSSEKIIFICYLSYVDYGFRIRLGQTRMEYSKLDIAYFM